MTELLDEPASGPARQAVVGIDALELEARVGGILAAVGLAVRVVREGRLDS